MARRFRWPGTHLVLASAPMVFVGCSNNASTPPLGSTGCCVCDHPPDSSIRPPERPSAHGASGETRWFVLHTVQFERNPGKPGSEEWEHIGFDLDGRYTTPSDSRDRTDTCLRKPGSATGILADGCGGIDNNFLSHVEPTLEWIIAPAFCGSLCPSPHNVEPDSNAAIAAGGETLVLRVDNFTNADEANAPGALFRTGTFSAGIPTFAASETWPISSDSLADGKDIGEPIVTFPDGYVTNGTWVSRTASTRFALALYPGKRSGDPRLELPIDNGMVAFDLTSGAGTLAGMMDLDAFETATTPWAVMLGTCPGNATFDQVMTTFAQGVDLVLDGPQFQDTTRECNAISLGIGITMAPMSAPADVVPPVSPPTPPSDCTTPDAGSSDAQPDSDASDAD